MRPDIKWRISSQGSKKSNSKSFLSFALVFIALIFLGLVYLFSLYDQRLTPVKFKESQPVSIALTDFHSPELLAKIPDQSISQHEVTQKEQNSIQTILQNLNLESSTFVLAQIAHQAQNHGQKDTFYSSPEKFYAFLSQTFLKSGSKDASSSDFLASNALFNLNAKSFENPEKLSLISLVILKLGEDASLTKRAIDILPKEITFGYLPYDDQVTTSIQSAFDAGHEVLIMIPMEPLDYPDSDPGAGTLLTGLDASQIQQRLQGHLHKSKQIIGITNFLGSRFAFSSPDVKVLIDELKAQGLMILDANTSPRSLISEMAQNANLPYAHTAFQIDTDLSAEEIKSKLFMLEQQALKEGKAVGYIFVNDLTLETIVSWSKTLSQRGIALAPLTYLVRK